MVETIGIILAILTALFVGYPLLQKRQQKVSFALNHRAQELEARKAEIYAAIRDIDFDYRMGKLSQEDYETLREQYKTEAIGMMKQIDEMQLGKSHRSVKEPAAAKSDGRFCHHCGQPAAAADQFCSACGGQLA
ncbi:MAG: zinc ribbon domain-containing protein [bacterium]